MPTEPVMDIDTLPFLAGGGETARMIRARDWSDHPLGVPEGWPEALRVALSLVLNSPESMILAWGPDLHFFFNDTYVPLLGPRLSWAMGARFDEVWADAWAQAKPIIDDAFAGRSTRFVDLPWTLDTDRGARETWWSFSYSRVLAADGSVAGLFIFTKETTGRVLSDAALAASQTRLVAALDDLRALNATLERRVEERTRDRNSLWQLSTDIMLRCGFDGRIIAVNPAWTEMLGWREDELVGADLFDLVHPDDIPKTVDGARATSEGETLARFDNRYRHRDGDYRWISWSARPAEGVINAVGRDVTAEREKAAALQLAEDALRQSQKMEAVGRLTGGVAHDFNNLLTIIRASVDFLRRPELPEVRRRRYLDAVSDTVDRAAKLTGQLLAFARRQALKPEVIDVDVRMRAIADMLDSVTGARIRVAIETPDAPCFVRADLGQFETAVINMAVNARDAMDGEGTLTLRLASGVPMPAIRGHAAAPGPFVALGLTDTGAGIGPDQIGRIFEPFFTTKAVGKGTGLGLSQVFGFAKQSGGDVDVESRIGAGSTFTLYLPEVAAEARPEGADRPEAPSFPVGSGQRVLVVEDNIEVGRFATQILQDLGYETVWAANAEEALERLGPDGTGIDAVFSDVVMPGMGGIALAKRLRQTLPGMPVLLASGYSHVLAEEGTHGFDLLQKPYSAEQLGLLLLRALGNRQPRL